MMMMMMIHNYHDNTCKHKKTCMNDAVTVMMINDGDDGDNDDGDSDDEYRTCNI